MTSTELYLFIAAVVSLVVAALLLWAAVVVHLRYRRSQHPRVHYRASDSTVPVVRR